MVSTNCYSYAVCFGLFQSERRDEAAVGHFFVFRNFGRMYIKNSVCAFGHSIANSLGNFSEVVRKTLFPYVCIRFLLEVAVLIYLSSDWVYYRGLFVLIRIGGDHAGDKILLETVRHNLRNDVFHLLVVCSRGVVVGIDECRFMFVVAFWAWDIKQHWECPVHTFLRGHPCNFMSH